MDDFIAQTLRGERPAHLTQRCGEITVEWLDEGIIQLTPRGLTRGALVISAGIHGNETAPVEMLGELLAPLLRGERPLVWRLLVVLGSPAALRAGRRFMDYDLNRLFGGRWQEATPGYETARAARLEQALETFFAAGDEPVRWHLDLHTAIRGSQFPRFGVLPARTAAWPEDFLTWLGDAGLQALVFHRAPGGTFSHFSCERFDALSCTLELGKALPFGHNDLSQFALTGRALAALLDDSPLPAADTPPRRFEVAQQLTRRSEHFVLHMSGDTENFTAFSAGTLLAEDGDERYYAQDVERVLFPNPSVALGLRAGLMLREM
ncbi:succinylglutamate desuccinylase [Cronobacter dublinensis]|uniref:succinylglutamate desuccinylase n=1 Tax=Cronobacter dublinensis TaxID=413497 RepID=UPI0024AEE4DC|nr:succinylglutamate desuccinylase [Cronobacter dublinensis]EKY3225049.1 succinylglutamate desuccinylase [Cronobacter dublinensis]ELQ6171474.1 succinylglutamate desuccinylase [Cronobacter dublinensis]MDI7506014.1 succinylglutamate desuccinylase [Cronobacter dublinensis]